MALLTDPQALIRWAGSRDPFLIADSLGIPVHHLHHPESRLPGLTCLVANRPSIFLNDAYFDKLPSRYHVYTEENIHEDVLQVAAHELGHSCLHRDQLRLAPIKEYEIFNVRTTLEAEANKFAAGILIDREEMLDLLATDLSILQVASKMHVNVNLLIYMIEILREEGMSFNSLPYIPRTNFIGSIHGFGSAEWED